MQEEEKGGAKLVYPGPRKAGAAARLDWVWLGVGVAKEEGDCR